MRFLLPVLVLIYGLQWGAIGSGFDSEARVVEPHAITVHTRVQLPHEGALGDVEAIWLAGLAIGKGDAPTALSVVWSEKGGWFPVWSLQLQSDASMLPVDLRAEAGTGPLAGSDTFAVPGIARPRWGHVYETVLSYHPTTGAISLWIHDATEDETLFAGEYLGGRTDTQLHPAAGVQLAGRFVPIDDVTTASVYVPRGVTWRVVEIAGGKAGSVPVTRLNRSAMHEVGIHIQLTSAVEGTLRILSERGGDVEEIATLPNPTGQVVVPIAMDQLEPGTTTWMLEYVDSSGQTWFTDTRVLEVGQLRAKFEPTVFDRASEAVTGGLVLEADGPLEMPLRVLGQLSRQVWDEESRSYRQEAYETVTVYDDATTLTSEPIWLPLQIPVPEGEPGLWRVTFTVEPAIDVPATVSGAVRMFTTYEPAVGVEDGPFTVVVLPDMQYQTHLSPQGGNPTIFTRMIHWIAERASEDGIGLVLQVGDITDHNQPGQWEVAQNSLYLLDGVVPYALTVGNHDIGMGGNAATRETQFNTYFPVERYEDLPWFGGVFEPGRLENSYQRLRLGGQDYLVLSLEFLPRDEVLEWANQVVAEHPDQKVLLVTHTYTSVAGSQRSVYGDRYGITTDATTTVNTGIDIWNKLVSRHPNMLMVLSGHVTPDGTMPRQVKIGAGGNRVYEMLVNFQHRTRGGDGWLALLHFTPGSSLVGVELYSPYLGAYRTDQGDAFGVPFCIDLDAPHYTPVNESCPVLPEREQVVAAW